MDRRQRLNELRRRYDDVSVLINGIDEELARPGLPDLRRLALNKDRDAYERERAEIWEDYEQVRQEALLSSWDVADGNMNVPDGRIEKLSDQMGDVRVRLGLLEQEVKRLANEVAQMRRAAEAPESDWPPRYVLLFGVGLMVMLGLLVLISVQVL